MKDRYGTELKIGDTVITSVNYELVRGKIIDWYRDDGEVIVRVAYNSDVYSRFAHSMAKVTS